MMRRDLAKVIWRLAIAAAFLLLGVAPPARAEDGYDLWLRYRPMEAAALAQYRPLATAIVAAKATSPTLDAAQAELTRGLERLAGQAGGRGRAWPMARW